VDRTDYRKATGSTGSAASNSKILYTAEGLGNRGTDITVELVDNSTDDSDESLTITREETFNSEIDATTTHTADQYVALAIVDPNENNFDLTVNTSEPKGVTGTKRVVTVKPDTDGTGTITSTIQEVVDAVNNDTDASKVMSLSVNSGATGSNTVSTLSEDNIDTTISVELADTSGTIDSTANDVVDAINGNATAAAAITASKTGPGWQNQRLPALSCPSAVQSLPAPSAHTAFPAAAAGWPSCSYLWL
jgi:hypothetical protein